MTLGLGHELIITGHNNNIRGARYELRELLMEEGT